MIALLDVGHRPVPAPPRCFLHSAIHSSLLVYCSPSSLTLTSRLTHRLPKMRWTGRPTALIPFTLIKGDLQGGAHYATSTSA